MGIERMTGFHFSFTCLSLVGIPTLVGLAGCGADATASDDTPAGELGQEASALSPLDFQDASGLVRIRIKTCEPVASHLEPITGKNVAESICPVDTDWVMIGGGAEIVGEGQPGALLRASKPNPFPFDNGSEDFTSWVGRSADNRMSDGSQAFPHQLRTYVIGLQLEGLQYAEVRANMIPGQDAVTDTSTANPTATSVIPSNFVVLGGGGEVLPSVLQEPEALFPPLYLTESRANANGWRVTARNNQTTEVGDVKTYATAIKRCPTGWKGKCLSFTSFQSTGASSSGYGFAAVSVPSPWVLSSAGAFVQQGGAGRYLADLIPFNGAAQGVTARSKNHGGAGSGTTTAVAMAIRGPQPATITVGAGCTFEQAVATVNTQQVVGSCAAPTSNDTIFLPTSASAYVAAGINLDIHRSVTIAGSGVTSTTLQFSGGAPSGDAGLQVSGDDEVAVTFRNLTLRGVDGNQLSAVRTLGTTTTTFANTRVTNFGFAGIFNQSAEARVFVQSSTIDRNGIYGSLPLGGGILNHGILIVKDSTIRDNFAYLGGGIASFLRVEMEKSTVDNNQAIFTGGGIHSEGFVILKNSTISRNTTSNGESGAGGGGVFFRPPGAEYIEASNNTFAFNATAGDAGGLFVIDGSPAISGNIFAFNSADGAYPDVFINVASNASPLASNLVTNETGVLKNGVQVPCVTSCPNPSQCNEVICADPLLGSLTTTANGTASYALLPGSPAVDAMLCNPLITDDQRGTSRPQGSNCDMGSVELIPTAPLFGFEALAGWQSPAPLSLTTARKTQGLVGLSVGGSNYRHVKSAPFSSPPPAMGPTVRVDFFLPGNQPNPSYLGAVQLFASCPSANLYDAYVGQVELTGKPTNAFSTLAFALPTAVRNVFNQVHNDCSLDFGVNTNATPVSPVLDNVRFGP
jgi:hypothetical protein